MSYDQNFMNLEGRLNKIEETLNYTTEWLRIINYCQRNILVKFFYKEKCIHFFEQSSSHIPSNEDVLIFRDYDRNSSFKIRNINYFYYDKLQDEKYKLIIDIHLLRNE